MKRTKLIVGMLALVAVLFTGSSMFAKSFNESTLLPNNILVAAHDGYDYSRLYIFDYKTGKTLGSTRSYWRKTEKKSPFGVITSRTYTTSVVPNGVEIAVSVTGYTASSPTGRVDIYLLSNTGSKVTFTFQREINVPAG